MVNFQLRPTTTSPARTPGCSDYRTAVRGALLLTMAEARARTAQFLSSCRVLGWLFTQSKEVSLAL